jgi:hypothetical protein
MIVLSVSNGGRSRKLVLPWRASDFRRLADPHRILAGSNLRTGAAIRFEINSISMIGADHDKKRFAQLEK